MTWAEVTAAQDVADGVDALRVLAAEYMTEGNLWTHAAMHARLFETADRLARIAAVAQDRVATDPSFADVVDAFVFAGRLQLDHVQSTRRFAYGNAPTVIPRRAGRE